MPVEDRIELLKSNILHCTKDLLKFDVVEIRLMDQKTKQLIPLLEVGMDPEAAQRDAVCPASRATASPASSRRRARATSARTPPTTRSI